jgi:hypothetical protein
MRSPISSTRTAPSVARTARPARSHDRFGRIPSVTRPLGIVRELPLSRSQHRTCRLIVETRVLLAVSVPPALPSFGCVVAAPDLLVEMSTLPVSVHAPSCYACLAIAQTKPDSSRAIAAVTTVAGFPARASLRYRRHNRSCAFHAGATLDILHTVRRVAPVSGEHLVYKGRCHSQDRTPNGRGLKALV